MTEGFRPPPPAGPVGYPGTVAARQQEVDDRVQRIMGQDNAPPPPAPLSTAAIGLIAPSAVGPGDLDPQTLTQLYAVERLDDQTIAARYGISTRRAPDTVGP